MRFALGQSTKDHILKSALVPPFQTQGDGKMFGVKKKKKPKKPQLIFLKKVSLSPGRKSLNFCV